MFTLLPSSLTTINNLISKGSSEVLLKFENTIGNLELGNSVKQTTYFKVRNSDNTNWINPSGVLYNANVKIKEDRSIMIQQQTKILTKEIPFNPNNFSFQKTTLLSPVSTLLGTTLVINTNTITFTTETTMEHVSNTINALNIPNISSYIEEGYLVIFSTKYSINNEIYSNLKISGTSLTSLGLTNGEVKNCPHEIIYHGLKYKVSDYTNGLNNYLTYIEVQKV